MKGVICKCLQELVVEKFGKDKWEAILEKAGLPKNKVFTNVENVEDAQVLKLIDATCKVLGITPQQAADAFGEYKEAKNAKDFLLKMDSVHERTAKSVPGAQPPRFKYQQKDDKTLVMIYKSKRGLIDIMIGLIKGVGKYYKENLTVTKLGPDRVEIKFAK